MQKKNKAMLVALGLLVIPAVTIGSISFAQADTNQNQEQKTCLGAKNRHKGDRGANREQMQKVLDSGDYERFKSTFEGDRILETIDSEEKFNKLLKAHQLRQEARSIMQELGLGKKNPGPSQNN
jgi:hypothetical protein